MSVKQIPLAWLFGYVAIMAGVLGGLVYARSVALSTFGSTVAHEEWEAWREEAKKMASGEGPVRRRTPKSLEPPGLVLMRDYFAVCIAIAMVLSTVLYGTLMMLIRGVMSTPAFVDRSPQARKR